MKNLFQILSDSSVNVVFQNKNPQQSNSVSEDPQGIKKIPEFATLPPDLQKKVSETIKQMDNIKTNIDRLKKSIDSFKEIVNRASNGIEKNKNISDILSDQIALAEKERINAGDDAVKNLQAVSKKTRLEEIQNNMDDGIPNGKKILEIFSQEITAVNDEIKDAEDAGNEKDHVAALNKKKKLIKLQSGYQALLENSIQKDITDLLLPTLTEFPIINAAIEKRLEDLGTDSNTYFDIKDDQEVSLYDQMKNKYVEELLLIM